MIKKETKPAQNTNKPNNIQRERPATPEPSTFGKRMSESLGVIFSDDKKRSSKKK